MTVTAIHQHRHALLRARRIARMALDLGSLDLVSAANVLRYYGDQDDQRLADAIIRIMIDNAHPVLPEGCRSPGALSRLRGYLGSQK